MASIQPTSPIKTRFSTIVEHFRDDYKSKIGDWVCGYSALITVLGYIGEECVNTEVNKNKRHLDIGCGKGALCHLLSKQLQVGKVVGVDVVEKAICESRTRYCVTSQSSHITPIEFEFDVPLEFQLIERCKPLPFKQDTFDNVSACFVISGMSSRQKQIDFLKDAWDVLRDGGKLVILVNNPISYGTQFTSILLQGPNDIEEPDMWGPGCETKATFSQDGMPYLVCNDRWWPR